MLQNLRFKTREIMKSSWFHFYVMPIYSLNVLQIMLIPGQGIKPYHNKKTVNR